MYRNTGTRGINSSAIPKVEPAAEMTSMSKIVRVVPELLNLLINACMEAVIVPVRLTIPKRHLLKR